MKRILFVLVLLVCLVGQPTSVEAVNPTDMQQSGVIVISAPSGPDITTTSTTFVEIPKMKARIVTAAVGSLFVTYCAEADVLGGPYSMFVQITDNGATLLPDGVIFAFGSSMHTHCFTFIETNVAAGFHVIRANWTVQGGTASMGDRTMTITFAQSNAEELRLQGDPQGMST